MENARDAVAQNGDHDDRHDAPLATIKPATASARLRAAREMQGLTTADIAARTRITLRHVEALDRGDLAALPGRPYVLGFVRNYARALGLDEADLAALVRSELDSAAPRPAPRMVHQFDVDDPAKTPSRLLTWLALGLFVAVLVAGGVFWRSYYAPSTDLPSLIQPDPTPSPAAAPAAARPTPPPAAAGPVVFTAREDRSWVKFYDGHGQQLMQKQLALGESYTVPADAFEPKLWTGRPDALTITIGGQPAAPLSYHRGIVRDVPVTAQALLARTQPAAATPPLTSSSIPSVTPFNGVPTTGPVHHKARHSPVHETDSDAVQAIDLPPVGGASPSAEATPASAAQ